MKAPGSGSSLQGVVLAAGESSRFGSPKQLLEIDGIPMVRRAVELARGVCEGPVLVVTGAASGPVGDSLDGLPVRLVANPRWRDGLGGSLRVGLSSLDPDRECALVLPCDLPWLSGEDLARLVAAWATRPTRPAAARFDGVLGIPAILPRRLMPAIDLTAADRGARDFLRSPDADVTAVPMASAARDLDAPDDPAPG